MIRTRKPDSIRELFVAEESDRVTVILTTPGALDGRYDYLVAVYGRPLLDGYGTRIDATLGRRIYWADLPEDQRQVIAARLT